MQGQASAVACALCHTAATCTGVKGVKSDERNASELCGHCMTRMACSLWSSPETSQGLWSPAGPASLGRGVWPPARHALDALQQWHMCSPMVVLALRVTIVALALQGTIVALALQGAIEALALQGAIVALALQGAIVALALQGTAVTFSSFLHCLATKSPAAV